MVQIEHNRAMCWICYNGGLILTSISFAVGRSDWQTNGADDLQQLLLTLVLGKLIIHSG